jgi:RNA recognition motif-containing protein
MAVKLYVGNLPYTTTDDELRELFSPHGTVESTAVISDRESGRSKGFGFVELSSAEEAKAAIEALNGKDFGGRNLVVNEARPREDRPRDGGGNGFRQRSW